MKGTRFTNTVPNAHKAEALCAKKSILRPYPEYVGNDKTKAILRDFPTYYATVDGDIHNLKSKRKVKFDTTTNRVGLCRAGKQFQTGYHIQILTAFVPKPSGDYTVDHIDSRRGSWHALKNLRWATAIQQRANQVRSGIRSRRELIAYKTENEPESALMFNSSAELLQYLKLPEDKRTNARLYDSIVCKRPFEGHIVKAWIPADVGLWKHVPPSFIRGATGYLASEFGGWIRSPNGTCTKGEHRQKVRPSVSICSHGKPYHYKVARLITAAFHGIPSDPKWEANHIDGTKPLRNDANNLEWLSSSDNKKHAHKTGLVSYHKKSVIMSKLGADHKTFDSAVQAMQFLRDKGLSVSSSSEISKCCYDKRKAAHGYTWRFA